MATPVPSSFRFPYFYQQSHPYFYPETHLEALKCLKLDLFEGLRMDLTKFFTNNFCMSHRFQNQQISCLNLAATTINYTDSKLMLWGKVAKDGPLNARFKYDFTHNLALTANLHVTDEAHGLIKFDYKGLFHNRIDVQFYMGSGGLIGLPYTTKNVLRFPLSITIEPFRKAHHTKFDFAYVARYDDGKTIATAQYFILRKYIAMSYVHKVNEKVCLAADFYHDYKSRNRNIRASFGCCLNIPCGRGYIGQYDHNNVMMTQIKGKIDSNGVVAVLVQRAGSVFSFEFDHNKLDYKIGFGFKLSDYTSLFSQNTSKGWICNDTCSDFVKYMI